MHIFRSLLTYNTQNKDLFYTAETHKSPKRLVYTPKTSTHKRHSRETHKSPFMCIDRSFMCIDRYIQVPFVCRQAFLVTYGSLLCRIGLCFVYYIRQKRPKYVHKRPMFTQKRPMA